VALAEIKDDLSKYLRLAEDEEIVITRHGRAAGVLIGFGPEEDWFDRNPTRRCISEPNMGWTRRRPRIDG